jgi:DNA-binding MarR family transcriptional regulator
MDITELRGLLNVLELVTRRKKIIIELYPDKKLSHIELHEKTGIKKSNISNYVSELEKEGIVEVNRSTITKENRNFSIKLVQLKPLTLEIINKALKLLVPHEKKPLPDQDGFKKILDNLMNPRVQKHAADSVQILTRQYVIPYDSGFFKFLEDNLDEDQIKPVLVTLIKSAQNIVRDLDTNERENVLAILGSKSVSLAEKGKSSAIKIETTKLLKELGAYDVPYEELKELYLKQRHNGKNTSLFRSLILKNHRDDLMDLWLSMMDKFESATEAEKLWFEQEFALLR